MKKYFLLLLLGTALGLQGAYLENRNTAYDYHLQGMAADETGVYWTFTYDLVKTDYNCKVLKEVKLPGIHCGDMCTVDGDIFVSVFFRKKELIAANNNYRSAVYQFSKDLVLKKKYPLPIQQTIDGITFCNGKFYVALRMGNEVKKETVIMIFDKNFKTLQRMTLPIPFPTKFAAQNLTVVNGKILAAFYAPGDFSPLFAPETLKNAAKIKIKPAVGMAKVPSKIAGNDNTYLIGREVGKNGNWKCTARIVSISPDFQVKNSNLKNLK